MNIYGNNSSKSEGAYLDVNLGDVPYEGNSGFISNIDKFSSSDTIKEQLKQAPATKSESMKIMQKIGGVAMLTIGTAAAVVLSPVILPLGLMGIGVGIVVGKFLQTAIAINRREGEKGLPEQALKDYKVETSKMQVAAMKGSVLGALTTATLLTAGLILGGIALFMKADAKPTQTKESVPEEDEEMLFTNEHGSEVIFADYAGSELNKEAIPTMQNLVTDIEIEIREKNTRFSKERQNDELKEPTSVLAKAIQGLVNNGIETRKTDDLIKEIKDNPREFFKNKPFNIPDELMEKRDPFTNNIIYPLDFKPEEFAEEFSKIPDKKIAKLANSFIENLEIDNQKREVDNKLETINKKEAENEIDIMNKKYDEANQEVKELENYVQKLKNKISENSK